MYDAKTLELKGVKTFTYSGGRNLGIESITYDAAIGRYVSFTEKNPCLLIQFDKNFSIVDERPIDGIREVSAITYHNHSIWVLSDEEMKIYKLNPSTFSIEAKWSVPVLNPEGICFSKDGKLWIMSDDQEAVFLIPTIE
jgi:uncharacterized protein YjiK